nr:MAG: hypothetical protein H4RhizoLitter20703_000001 [Mitovirus sp.]
MDVLEIPATKASVKLFTKLLHCLWDLAVSNLPSPFIIKGEQRCWSVNYSTECHIMGFIIPTLCISPLKPILGHP